jgi:hypothetical protein
VKHSGTVNDNVSTSYTYDKADNRVNVTVSGVVGNWSPSTLFGGGAQGGWYDPSDLSSMWQDSAGTIAAAVNSPVGRIDDKSGNGHHLTQSTSGKRPYLRQSGSLYYLDFDGVDDRLFSAAFGASFAQSNMIALGAKTDATGSDYLVVDSTTDGSRNTIAVSTYHPGDWIAWSGSEEVPLGSASTSAAQIVIATLNGTSTIGEVNGVSGSTGNGGTNPMDGISLGGRFSDNYAYDGRIYALVVLDTPATGANLSTLRSWIATKTTSSAWSPSTLFGGGAQGAWYDPSDLSSMWQDSAGTIAAAVNAPVGRIDDKSGNGHHLSQSTSGKRPYLRQSGSLHYLDFDGVDDRLFSAAFSASFAQSNMIALAAKTDSTGPDYLVVDSTTDGSRNTIALSNYNAGKWVAWSGSEEVPLGSASTSATQIVIATLNGSSTSGEVSGVAGSTGNGGTNAMNGISLGGRFSDNYFYDGRIYGLVVLDTPATGTDLAALRSWLGTPP